MICGLKHKEDDAPCGANPYKIEILFKRILKGNTLLKHGSITKEINTFRMGSH